MLRPLGVVALFLLAGCAGHAPQVQDTSATPMPATAPAAAPTVPEAKPPVAAPALRTIAVDFRAGDMADACAQVPAVGCTGAGSNRAVFSDPVRLEGRIVAVDLTLDGDDARSVAGTFELVVLAGPACGTGCGAWSGQPVANHSGALPLHLAADGLQGNTDAAEARIGVLLHPDAAEPGHATLLRGGRVTGTITVQPTRPA